MRLRTPRALRGSALEHPVEMRRKQLRGERLLLRPYRRGDLADYAAMQSDPRVTRYHLWPIRSAEQSRRHLTERIRLTRVSHIGDFLALAVVLPGEPSLGGEADRVIGDISLRLHSVEHLRAEIGWITVPAFQSRGYAREAAELLLGLAFEELGLHSVFAQIDRRNIPSAALAERLGFSFRGIARDEFRVEGEWITSSYFDLLASEWQTRRKRHAHRPHGSECLPAA